MSAKPLRLAEPRFGPDALAALARVLESGQLAQGPVVAAFERAVAEYCGALHAVATTSATTALELALAALDIGPQAEVAIADFTYPATGNAVLQRGGRPRLVEADAETYCLDVRALDQVLTDDTAAVIAVDVFGLPADYEAIEPLLTDRGIPLICDAACSLGAMVGARHSGTFGRMSAFSFHPRKSLTTGEGGMVTTDDGELAARLRRLRNHGSERLGWRSTFVEPGFNYRMSDLNAALGLVQVPTHEEVVSRRRELAAALTDRLHDFESVTAQLEPKRHRHPYQAYVVTLADGIDRDAVIALLRTGGRGDARHLCTARGARVSQPMRDPARRPSGLRPSGQADIGPAPPSQHG